MPSRKRKLPRHHIALATLHTGSSNDDLDEEALCEELFEDSATDSAAPDSDPVDSDSDNKDSISMSTQVAVRVEAVPNMLNPLSSLPLGSYNVLEPNNFESYGLVGVRTTLGWLMLLFASEVLVVEIVVAPVFCFDLLLLHAKVIPIGKILLGLRRFRCC